MLRKSGAIKLSLNNFIKAAKNGDVAFLDRYLKSLGNAPDVINAVDDSKRTALYWAARVGHIDAVELLINNKVAVDFVCAHGETALLTAAQHGHKNVVAALLAAGANANVARLRGATPLFMAAQAGYVTVVELLIEHGANPDRERDDGVTPLYAAAYKGEADVVRVLLANRVDHTYQWCGKTAYDIAFKKGHIKSASLLFEHAHLEADKTKTVAKLYPNLALFRPKKKRSGSSKKTNEKHYLQLA